MAKLLIPSSADNDTVTLITDLENIITDMEAENVELTQLINSLTARVEALEKN